MLEWDFIFFLVAVPDLQVLDWGAGGQGSAFLQSCPAESQTISLLPCSPTTSSVEQGSWSKESQAMRERSTTGREGSKLFF